MVEVLFWVAVGIVVKTLVPMEWVDAPVRDAWSRVKGWFN